jgi:hypothetical protein
MKARSLIERMVPYVLIAIVAMIFWQAASGYIGNDEGSYIYEAKLILDGRVPFRDFATRAPFQVAIIAALAKAFGPTMDLLKSYDAALYALSGILLYLIARRWQGRAVSTCLALATMLAPPFLLSRLTVGTVALSMALVLAAMLAIGDGRRWSICLSGALLACAVFVREPVAIFVMGVAVYLVMNRQYDKAAAFVAGGLIVAIPVLGFFSYEIGLAATLSQVLGLGHVVVSEKAMSTGNALAQLGIFAVSILPFGVALMLARRSGKTTERGRAAYELSILWVVLMTAFYAAYFFKRGFMQSYGSEIIPMLSIIIAARCSVGDASVRCRYGRAAVSAAVAVAAYLSFYLLIKPPAGIAISRYAPMDLDFLAGSGIPMRNFTHIIDAVRSNSGSSDAILSGALSVPIASGRAQYMDMSRMMIYQWGSGLDALYAVPRRSEFVKDVKRDMPRIIVSDYHLAITVKPDLSGLLQAAYSPVYADDFAVVYVRKP